jgi:hypothetical protein
VEWQPPGYHNVLEFLRHPVYAGAYVFGRRGDRTRVVDGRARKTSGQRKPIEKWNVLLRDHHSGYITWAEYEKHQSMIAENAHMQKRTSRKSGRGGRALLTGMLRCGRCGRMMRVFYGMKSGHAHRYQCRGDEMRGATGLCIGIGGIRIDRAVASQLVEAISPHAIDAAVEAATLASNADDDVRRATERQLESAKYEARLAARRYEAVDPEKRLVARELEARWNTALQGVVELEERLAQLTTKANERPEIDRAALLALAHDLPSAWNAPTATTRTKQRIARILIKEVILDLDDNANQTIVTIHWAGGRHTELRVARVRTGRYPDDRHPSAVEVVRKMGGKWPDRDLAVTMNRMRCKGSGGNSWTTMRVRELRERLGVAAFDPNASREETVSVDETARRLSICVGSVYLLIRSGALPAKQIMPSAPWQIPVAALASEAVRIAVQRVVERRPRNVANLQHTMTLRLPGV